jgi:hypothetical protein
MSLPPASASPTKTFHTCVSQLYQRNNGLFQHQREFHSFLNCASMLTAAVLSRHLKNVNNAMLRVNVLVVCQLLFSGSSDDYGF